MMFGKYVNNIIKTVFSLIFLFLSFFLIIHPEKYPLGFPHYVLKNILFACIAFAIVKVGVLFCEKTKGKGGYYIRLIVILVLIILQIFYFEKTLTTIGWDAQELNNRAEFGIYDPRYYAFYPNQILSYLWLRSWLFLCRCIPVLSALRKMEILNLFCVDFSLIMLGFLAKKCFSEKTAYRIIVASILLLGFHPTLAVVYTDTLAMPFPIGTLVCFFKLKDGTTKKGKYKWAVLLGIVGTVGSFIKPTVIIMYIAIIIIIVCNIREFWNKEYGLALGIFALSVLLTLGVNAAVQKPVKDYVRNSCPGVHSRDMLHYIYLGLSNLDDNPSGYGCWNIPAITWTGQHAEDIDYKQQQIERIWNRMKEYGFWGYLGHWGDKLIWAGTDGTFFYGLEGGFHCDEQAPLTTLRGKLQESLYIESDFYQNWYSAWWQGVWLMICAMLAGTIFRKENSIYLSISKLGFLGLILFLLIFENRSRYWFLYLPVLLFSLGIPKEQVVQKE